MMKKTMYYCLPICDPDETLDRWPSDLAKVVSVEDFPAYWQAEGFTHVLVHQAGAIFLRENDSRYSPENWAMMATVMESLQIVEEIGSGYILYEFDNE